MTLQRYIEKGTDGMLHLMSHFFANFIYECLGIDQAEDIPLDRIKEEILKNNKNAKLLKMFCGADI